LPFSFRLAALCSCGLVFDALLFVITFSFNGMGVPAKKSGGEKHSLQGRPALGPG